ncbi:MAG: hypothetical protein PHP42_12080 [Bacteroidota bacterium]|nr:hypothetical protein [Bacteroidota bacterium]
MNCKEFREKMYLRDDELEPRELSEMKQHRLECVECRTEYALVASVHKITDAVKTQVPELTDPLLLTNSVLSRIKEEAVRAHSSRPVPAFDRFAALLAAPSVRLAMAIMLFIIAGSFAVEYTSGYVYLKGYEERIGRSSEWQEDDMASFVGQGNLPNAAEYLLKIVSGKKSFVEVSENWVLMDKKSLQNYLLLYNELKGNASQLSPQFRAANPHLAELLMNKQQSMQLDTLLKERESIIRELNRLVPKERKMP